MDKMVYQSEELIQSALRIYSRLSQKYEDGSGLFGPDEYPRWPEGAFFSIAYPIYRSLSGLRILSYPRRRLTQAQAYWIIANLFLHKQFSDPRYLKAALRTGSWLLTNQASDGSWPVLIPGWNKGISTVFCTWGALALSKLYKETGRTDFLDAALRWKDCLVNRVGTLRTVYGGSEIELFRYFDTENTAAVSNASTLGLAFLSNLRPYLSNRDEQLIEKLINSVCAFQHSSGEIAYSNHLHHYRCASYNGFEFVDLCEAVRNHISVKAYTLLQGMAEFLCDSVRRSHGVPYDCEGLYPHIFYQDLIVATALHYAFLLFHRSEFGQARDMAISEFTRISRRDRDWGFGRHKFFVVEYPDQAFFSRQAAYTLVCLLRLTLVNDLRYLDQSLI